MSAARENNFLQKYPEIAAEWHPSLNGEWKPDNVSAGSNKIFWWICEKNHAYKSIIPHRVEGTGCPYCAGKKVLKGFNDLATISLSAIAEWDFDRNQPLTPYLVTLKSGKKVWWKCAQGHSYSMTVAAKTSGMGCPYCAGRYVIVGETDLETCYPEIAEEWDCARNEPVKPSQIKPHRNQTYWWICKNGHHYRATPSARIAGRGCPYCSNRKVLPGFNDLQTRLPELAKEWHPTKNGDLLPTMVTPRGDSVIWWKCSVCGFEWKVTLNRRCGCPKCSDKRQTSFPEQAIYYYIQKVFPDAVNRYRYRGYELDLYIPSIRTAVEYDGVYYHNSRRNQEKDNIKDSYCEEDGIKLYRIRDPQLGTTRSATIIPCKDTIREDHLEKAIKKLFDCIGVEDAPDIDIQRDGHIILSMTQKYYRDRNLASLFPVVAAEWDYEKNAPLLPENVTPGSSHQVWWRCGQGHEWQATVNSRTSGTGCPYCAGKKCLPGVNDLMTLRPDIAAEWNWDRNGNLTPDKILSKSNQKVWWKCSICGTEWETSVSNMRRPHCKQWNDEPHDQIESKDDIDRF